MSLIEQHHKPARATGSWAESLPSRQRLAVAVGRQVVRRLGLIEIRARLKQMFPHYSRSEIRQLAVELNRQAWDGRDKDAIERARRPAAL